MSFKVGRNLWINKDSVILRSDLFSELPIIEKLFKLIGWLLFSQWSLIEEWRGREMGLLVLKERPICSEQRTNSWRAVLPMYTCWQQWHLYLYITCDLMNTSVCSFNLKKLPIVEDVRKYHCIWTWGKNLLISKLISLFKLWDWLDK